MVESIRFDIVADIYDTYVNTMIDIPFFLHETENVSGKILELMCGTGRVSIPLLEQGRHLTCVDYSQGMLDVFAKKIQGKPYQVELLKMDVCQLDINERYSCIILPFHSFAEILTEENQISALEKIYQHLTVPILDFGFWILDYFSVQAPPLVGGTNLKSPSPVPLWTGSIQNRKSKIQNRLTPNGIFICTLRNRQLLLKSGDGQLRILGKFPKENNENMIVYYTNQFNPDTELFTGFQFYEIYNSVQKLVEKRMLDINFRLIDKNSFERMVTSVGFTIEKLIGDYSYAEFNEENSPFMIWFLRKKGE
jgi:SAM-dependent methyltransferase